MTDPSTGLLQNKRDIIILITINPTSKYSIVMNSLIYTGKKSVILNTPSIFNKNATRGSKKNIVVKHKKW
jgi:hypothetical protein